jgi:hypothetical protein
VIFSNKLLKEAKSNEPSLWFEIKKYFSRFSCNHIWEYEEDEVLDDMFDYNGRIPVYCVKCDKEKYVHRDILKKIENLNN